MGFGGDGQHAGALPVDLHVVFLDIGRHAVEVRHTEALELVELLGPARLPVLGAVGEAGVDEAAVASRCRPPDPFGLDQHDLRAGVTFGGVQCRPQSGVAATDHEQVAGGRTGQAGIVRAGYVKPHRPEGCRGESACDQSLVDGIVENDAHAEMVPRPAGSQPGGPKI